jgi:hypothetical protein
VIQTEAEAKTKWCPMKRTGAFTDRGQTMAVAVNFDPRPEVADSCNCEASRCMMWRWFDHKRHANKGYCGLAMLPVVRG